MKTFTTALKMSVILSQGGQMTFAAGRGNFKVKGTFTLSLLLLRLHVWLKVFNSGLDYGRVKRKLKRTAFIE